MKIEVVITHVLPASVEALLAQVLNPMLRAQPAAEATPEVETPKKRRAKTDEPKPEPKPEPKVDPVTPAKGPTFDDLKNLVNEAMDSVGTAAVREVFSTFKIKRLADLDVARYPAMAAALRDAKGLVE